MTRKRGGGCGCGAMGMLGFPKTGGFLGLFGGDEAIKSQGTAMPSQPMGMSAQPTMTNGSVMTPRRRPMKRQQQPQPQSPGESFGMPMNTEQQQDVKGKKSRIVSEIKTLKSDVNRIKEQLSKMNTSFKVDNTNSSPGLFGGGYRPTRKNKKYLKMYKQGKSIGFTMRSSLKAKGLIPRANGTYKISNKYRG